MSAAGATTIKSYSVKNCDSNIRKAITSHSVKKRIGSGGKREILAPCKPPAMQIRASDQR